MGKLRGASLIPKRISLRAHFGKWETLLQIVRAYAKQKDDFLTRYAPPANFATCVLALL